MYPRWLPEEIQCPRCGRNLQWVSECWRLECDCGFAVYFEYRRGADLSAPLPEWPPHVDSTWRERKWIIQKLKISALQFNRGVESDARHSDSKKGVQDLVPASPVSRRRLRASTGEKAVRKL